MLRIRETAADDGVALLVEGRLAGPWVQELRSAAEAQLASGGCLLVDISGVGFADQGGVRLLRDLRLREVEVIGASQFLVELLAGDGR